MRGVALPQASSWSMVTTRLLTHNVKLRKSVENIKLWLNCCPHCPKLKLGYGHLQKSQPQISISVAAKTALSPFPTSFQKPARLVLPALRVLFFARHIKSRNQKIIHRHEVCKKLYKSLKKDIYKALFLLRNSHDMKP